MQIGARGLRGAARFRKAPASVPAPPEPARPHWCERHFHHKPLHCMSMLRPAWDPRTAAPGLAAGVGGCPGLAWGRVKGVGKRVSYLCKGQRQLRETKRHPGCCHFRRWWWWWSPPSGPQAPTDPKSACPTRDPSFPLLVKLSPPGGRTTVHSCLLQAGILLLPNLSGGSLEAQPLARPALLAFSHPEDFCAKFTRLEEKTERPRLSKSPPSLHPSEKRMKKVSENHRAREGESGCRTSEFGVGFAPLNHKV